MAKAAVHVLTVVGVAVGVAFVSNRLSTLLCVGPCSFTAADSKSASFKLLKVDWPLFDEVIEKEGLEDGAAIRMRGDFTCSCIAVEVGMVPDWFTPSMTSFARVEPDSLSCMVGGASPKLPPRVVSVAPAGVGVGVAPAEVGVGGVTARGELETVGE